MDDAGSSLRVIYGVLVSLAAVAVVMAKLGAPHRSGTHDPNPEPTEITLGRVALIVAAALLAGLYLAGFAFPEALRWELPLWLRIVGLLDAALNTAFILWALRTLGKNLTTSVLTHSNEHQLVTAGPFGWVRHPIYLAGISLLVDSALISGLWPFLALALVAWAFFQFHVIPLEEANLAARFGPEWEAYAASTGALWPGVGKVDRRNGIGNGRDE